MSSSIDVNYYFKEEIIMLWYEEKDLAAEAVQDYIFMGGNEDSRPDTVFTVSEKYGIRLRVCPSGLRTWEGEYEEYTTAFEKCYSKVVKVGYTDFVALPLEEREHYCELIINEWQNTLELINQLKAELEKLKCSLQKEAGNRKLLKIGVGVNIRSGRPNFQIWLKIDSLTVSVRDYFDGRRVELTGTLYCAKNWTEVQKGNYDEVVKLLVEPYGVPGTTRHVFQLSGLLSPEATRELQEMTVELSKAQPL